jgi:hypothetical protein
MTARVRQRVLAGFAERGPIRVLAGFAERGPIRDLLCLPTAPALPLWGTETSERRRFLAALGQAAACLYPGIWGVET